MTRSADVFGQREYGVRFDWGTAGAVALGADVSVIVDVLSFSTAVCAAVARDIEVLSFGGARVPQGDESGGDGDRRPVRRNAAAPGGGDARVRPRQPTHLVLAASGVPVEGVGSAQISSVRPVG